MCIENIICLELPIKWDELGVIATICGTLATFCTVLVALCANHKATKQLKSALRMQEQSKNVALFKERIELAESIQSEKSVSELALQVLFNDEILEHYKAWREHCTEKDYAENDLKTFFHLSRTPEDAGGYTNKIQDTIYQFEATMNRPDCPQQTIDDYKAFCDQHTFWDKVGEDDELTPYNHAEISNRMAKAIIDAKREQELTLQLIKKFIAYSIQEIDEKKWWERVKAFFSRKE